MIVLFKSILLVEERENILGICFHDDNSKFLLEKLLDQHNFLNILYDIW